ncbi:MAG TPA: VWA domain-containing protein [Myxococcota bacterium]|nr:VWA domain-containing protein [Myxococcota bacterium]
MSPSADRVCRLLTLATLALLAPLAPLSAARSETLPAVTRPTFLVGSELRAAGTAFFIPVKDEVGVAAIATAHAVSLDDLAKTKEVEFRLGSTQQPVTVSSRFLVSPGRPYFAAGASVSDDFLVFALDAAPHGARVLEPDPRGATVGERVQLLGLPAQVPQGETPRDEEAQFGTVTAVVADRIDVDLDTKADLRGWGGAPVLSYDKRRVIGLLEAAQPQGVTLRLKVSPIAAVTTALQTPLDGGLGRAFSGFRAEDTGPPPRVEPPQTASNTARDLSPDALPLPQKSKDHGSSGPSSASPPLASNSAAPSRSAAEAAGAAHLPRRPLLGKSAGGATNLQLVVDQPAEGAIFGEQKGAFVAGRALALHGEMRHFDVAIVIDTSGSTMMSSGADVNGNGIVGRDRPWGIFGLPSSTDPGDSVLAAEVAAARRMLKGLDPRSTRVALITFSGSIPSGPQGGFVFGGRGRGTAAAITEQPLTTDYARIEKTLTHVLERGSDGGTHMAAAIDQATTELLGLEGALSQVDKTSEKFVLFLTDGQPTLPYGPGFDADNVRAVLRAADRAQRAGVRIHSFAIGPEAMEGPVSCVEMSERTHGIFTPVKNPGELTDVIEQVNFANIDEITVKNVTTGKPADVERAKADGSFGALVPLQQGKNKLEIYARSSDGAESRANITVVYAPGTPDPVLPVELIAVENQLLEQKLIELRRGRIEAERAQAEEVRKELALQIDKERAAAQERAAQQRKELKIEVDRDAPPQGAAQPQTPAQPQGSAPP